MITLSDIRGISFNDMYDFCMRFGLTLPIECYKTDVEHAIFDQYCKLKKYLSYTYVKQLGREGKEGRTFLAIDTDSNQVAVKVFKKDKKAVEIAREVEMQTIASAHGIAPPVIQYDIDGRYIVMDKLDTNLYDCFVQQKGQLTLEQQQAVIRLFKRLDECKVFHADPNPLNFMAKNEQWYMIDYGFAMPIVTKTIIRFGETPNMKHMPTALVNKLRKVYPDAKLEYIESFIV